MTRTIMAVMTALALGAASAQAQTRAAAPTAAATAATNTAPVNLNTATADQLATIPGIGAKTAERIVEYRQKNGGFKKVEDLMNIRGVGEKNFLKMKPLLTVAVMKGGAAER